MTATTEYDRRKTENALWRANIGAPKTGKSQITQAAEDAYWKAKDAGATTQAATEAARSAFEAARAAFFSGEPIPTAKPSKTGDTGAAAHVADVATEAEAWLASLSLIHI